jgi:Zn-dependent protease with chaperone function
MAHMCRFLSSLVIFLFVLASPASATLTPGTIIRDAEIEDILHSYLDPIFRKAGLNPKDLRLVLIVDREINAAATFNNTMVLNTGFLLATENLQQVLGVLAHETGHIAERHLVRLVDAHSDATKHSILAAAAGVALGVLSGRPDVGAAMAMGGGISSTYAFLSHSRTEETAADLAAIRYLNELCWAAEGLQHFLEKLLSQELLSSSMQDPYVRSHPLTRDRVEAIRHWIAHSCQKPLPKKMLDDYKIMTTKLAAFLDNPAIGFQKFSGSTELDRYAQSILYYRQKDFQKALSLLDGLLAEYPSNPFYWELKGQILYESGKIKESIGPYRKANALKPNNPLLMFTLAQSLVGMEDKLFLKEARSLLEKASTLDTENASIWYFLSIVYGRLGDMGNMALCLAEREIVLQHWQEAHQQVLRALNFLKKGTKTYMRAMDLKNITSRESNPATKTDQF